MIRYQMQFNNSNTTHKELRISIEEKKNVDLQITWLACMAYLH